MRIGALTRGFPSTRVAYAGAHQYKYLIINDLLAERVGFAPLLGIENKELIGFQLPLDPLDRLESPGRDTY